MDVYHEAMMTTREAAWYLEIPRRTLSRWQNTTVASMPLVHSVPAERQGWPSLPFVAVIEAYVLRALRDLHVGLPKIREAVTAVRREFGEPYALATRRIATDGVDIFIEYTGGDLVRAADRQLPIREVITEHLRYIEWDVSGQTPQRLRLRQYADVAPVVIDPRFGWGSPVLADSKIRVDAIQDLFKAGESIATVAGEFGLRYEQVEEVCRVALRASA